MGMLQRLRRRGTSAPDDGQPARGAARAHLEEFTRSRHGVEAFLEPATTVTPATILLIAHDGEWTRRRVPDHKTGADFARALGIPVYDVQLVGYPQRMRDYNARQRGRD